MDKLAFGGGLGWGDLCYALRRRHRDFELAKLLSIGCECDERLPLAGAKLVCEKALEDFDGGEDVKAAGGGEEFFFHLRFDGREFLLCAVAGEVEASASMVATRAAAIAA